MCVLCHVDLRLALLIQCVSIVCFGALVFVVYFPFQLWIRVITTQNIHIILEFKQPYLERILSLPPFGSLAISVLIHTLVLPDVCARRDMHTQSSWSFSWHHTTFMKSVHIQKALNKIAWKLMEKWMKFNFIEILERQAHFRMLSCGYDESCAFSTLKHMNEFRFGGFSVFSSGKSSCCCYIFPNNNKNLPKTASKLSSIGKFRRITEKLKNRFYSQTNNVCCLFVHWFTVALQTFFEVRRDYFRMENLQIGEITCVYVSV